ncbi:MAG: PD40 domain-containing protein [Bacteroidales bacterium]|nr:PD40 domain-containing protein [Bacteroidales bacterium]
MRRFLLFFLLLFALLDPIDAQQYERSANKDYGALFAQINRDYRENPDNVATLVAFSDYYADTLNPQCNLPLAMDFILRADDLYRMMLNSDDYYREVKKLLKKKINLQSLRSRHQSILNNARRVAEHSDQMNENEISRYAESFRFDDTISRMVRLQRVQGAFLSAQQQNTIEAFYAFEQDYRGTAEADSAELIIASMAPSLFDHVESVAEIDAIAQRFQQSESVQRYAQAHKSRIAYANAHMVHTVDAYRAFLSAYPSSSEYFQALDEMEKLLQNQFSGLSSPQDYVAFIEQNSDDDLAELAMERLCNIIRSEKNVEAAKAYIDKFPLDPHYNDIFRLYYDWHASEGNLQPVLSFANRYKDYPFKTALHADLVEGAQIDSFDLMRPFVESRKADYVDFIRQHTGKRIAFVALQRMLQPLCARHEWNAASDRMGSVLLSFEDVCNSEFTALRSLLTTAPRQWSDVSLLYAPSHSVSHPVLHPDGRSLFFSAAAGTSEAIYSVSRGPNGRWQQSQPISFSNADNDGLTIFNFFDNGNKMLLGHDGDIWIAERDQDQWRIVEIPPFPVNTDYIESDAYMLPDGTGLILISDRPGGYNLQQSHSLFHGDTALATDIYFIPRTLKGWGSPVNLGPNINTTYCERSPILSKDQRTLFFVSDGHGGMGYGDLYMATRSSTDRWTQWSKPINMGRVVNSSLDEASISFAPGETHLTITSNHRGRYEAYSVTNPHPAAEALRTFTFDAASLGRSLTRIAVADNTVQAMTHELSYPDATHPISLQLATGKRYIIFASAPGLLVAPIFVNDHSTDTIPLKGLSRRQLVAQRNPLPLRTVVFEFSKVQPTPISMVELDQLADFLERNDGLRISLVVAAKDPDKKKAYALSLERAQTLRRYLSSRGIDISRIEASGIGTLSNEYPLADHGQQVWVRFIE